MLEIGWCDRDGRADSLYIKIGEGHGVPSDQRSGTSASETLVDGQADGHVVARVRSHCLTGQRLRAVPGSYGQESRLVPILRESRKKVRCSPVCTPSSPIFVQVSLQLRIRQFNVDLFLSASPGNSIILGRHGVKSASSIMISRWQKQIRRDETIGLLDALHIPHFSLPRKLYVCETRQGC